MVKFGIQHPSFTFDGKGEQISSAIANKAKFAEAHGFDSFWVMDHLLQIPSVGSIEEPMLEGWSTISFLSAITSKIKIGTLVTGNIYRYPSLLAKVSSTVDLLSKGRLFMGLGAGWFEQEATAYGIPSYTVAERIRRLEESVKILLGMWTTNDKFTFKGKYYQVENAFCNPKPVQSPHPPLLIGGGGEQMTLKIVAKYANACNFFGGPKTVAHKVQKLKEHCSTVGRDHNEIIVSKLGHVIISRDENELHTIVSKSIRPGMTRDQLDEYLIYGTPAEVKKKLHEFLDAGVQYMIFNLDSEREEKMLELLAEEVVQDFNE